MVTFDQSRDNSVATDLPIKHRRLTDVVKVQQLTHHPVTNADNWDQPVNTYTLKIWFINVSAETILTSDRIKLTT